MRSRGAFNRLRVKTASDGREVAPWIQENDAKPLLNCAAQFSNGFVSTAAVDVHRELELMAMASTRASRVLRQNRERKLSGERKAILRGKDGPSVV